MTQKRTLKNYLTLSGKGIIMGIADVVPGVSGGTIAFITGIYEELINSIKSINLSALKEFKLNGIKGFWKSINGSFLFALLTGIGISIAGFSKIILHLLEHYPILIWSFFFGLILASAIIIGKGIKRWSIGTLSALSSGLVIAYIITVLSPTETTTAPWFIFLSGAIAICAMILPGISGSFILLLMGKYEYILNSIKDLNLSVLILFSLGCASGLISFSHLLSWMFKKFHDLTLAVLTGFMIGSLNKVWPWKKVIDKVMINGKEKVLQEINLSPESYFNQTGNPSLLAYAIFAASIGFIVVYLIERLASGRTNNA